jgi:4-amino-4-deoxy-L-arabinose transferase-like glycosyltransferase
MGAPGLPALSAASRTESGVRSRSRFWRRDSRPWWSWAGLGVIAALSVVLFTWGLSRNGMGNAYYAAAVKSGSLSWKAFFFGSLDPGSFITVDKPPASLWLQEVSARLFGFSSWSILLPQAIAGVASIVILYRLVRRWQGDVAGLLAALALALTPVAVVMFRFNNPDALLTLLLLAAAWALWSALERGSTWMLVGCGVLVGFAFLAKMLEALVVLPAFALVYLVCAPPKLGRRLLQVLVAGVALVVSGGWWVAIVELWPSATRPYIGGTSDNSVLGLIFSRSAGYLSSGSGSPDLGAAGLPHFSGPPGWLRIFDTQLGGQISWLVPLALVGLGVGLWMTRRAPRTDRSRAGYLLWGAWTLLYLAVFSMAKGVLHPYYTVVLAPSIAALVGAGSVAMWRLGREHRRLSWLLPVAVVGTAVLSAYLLRRTRGYVPGLGPAVVIVGLVAAAGLGLAISRVVRTRFPVLAAVVLATACVLAGPAAYSISRIPGGVTGLFAAAGPAPASKSASGGLGGAQPADQTTADRSLADFLLANRGGAEFLAAVEGAQTAEFIIIDTGQPVMTLRGFSGSDPWPTLSRFQELVTRGKVRYVLAGGSQPGGGAGGTYSDIQQWVSERGTVVDPGKYGGDARGGTLYQLW